jgi:hypothetical protein
MKRLYDWLKKVLSLGRSEQKKLSENSFSLTAETVGELEILGGIDWEADDDWLREQLDHFTGEKDREQFLANTRAYRESVEIEHNRDRMMQGFRLMTPAQIKKIEDKINAGETLFATDPTLKIERRIAEPIELEY